VQRGRIEYEGETSVYTQISPLKIRGKDEYILIFPGVLPKPREFNLFHTIHNISAD
jgi:hypothetical protein